MSKGTARVHHSSRAMVSIPGTISGVWILNADGTITACDDTNTPTQEFREVTEADEDARARAEIARWWYDPEIESA